MKQKVGRCVIKIAFASEEYKPNNYLKNMPSGIATISNNFLILDVVWLQSTRKQIQRETTLGM